MGPKLRRSAISLETKLKIIKLVDKKEINYHEIGKLFKVPKSTIAGIVRNRIKYENEVTTYPKRQKIRSGNHPNLEQGLNIWLKSIRHAGVSINGTIFKEKAVVLATKLNILDFQDEWLDRFKKQNGVSFKNIVGENLSVCQETCFDWVKNKLPTILNGYAKNNIFNLDETSLFFKMMPNKTLTFKNENARMEN